MRVDFPKKSNVLVQKQKCGISNLGCAVLNCAILAVASTGIVLVCSVLIKHDRIS